jgi:hypothetical protein
MRLHAVKFAHYSQKDSEEGIKGYVIADTEEQVMLFIDANYRHDSWSDEGMLDVWDDKLEKLIEVPYLEKIRKERGEFWEEVSDLYYGATQYGWDEGQEITPEEAAILIRLGIAEAANVNEEEKQADGLLPTD